MSMIQFNKQGTYKWSEMILVMLSFAMLFYSCKEKEHSADGSGAFEAEETIISSQAQGMLMQFNVQEGQTLVAGDDVGYVDSVQLSLKKRQLEAQILALVGKRPDIPVQLSVLQEQLSAAMKERERISNLVKGDAATPKQLDDINDQVRLFQKQIAAQKSSLHISSSGISKEATAMEIQLLEIEDQLKKCTITNPVNGTVLSKYAEQNEVVSPGKPLYKIADLSNIILRAYITGGQLALAKLNQSVKVLTDNGKGGFNETEGVITWISDKAEFTPKTIQTKEERANKVYAIKVKVENDGKYKIGMYGEIKF